MIAKIVFLFYVIFVLPVIGITMCGLIYGSIVELNKYIKGQTHGTPGS